MKLRYLINDYQIKKIIIILFLFFIDIGINNSSMVNLNKEITQCFFKEPNDFIYISFQTFIDADTKSSTMMTEEGKLLNNAFYNALNDKKLFNPANIIINAKDHLIKDCDKNTNRIITIITSPEHEKYEKVMMIFNEFIIDKSIDWLDGVFTGEYKNYKTHIELTIYWILINKIIYNVEKIIIPKKDIICSNTLCDKSKQMINKLIFDSFLSTCFEIRNMLFQFQINELFWEMINQKFQPPKGQGHIYVTHLTFMDPVISSSMLQTEEGTLINDAVKNGIHLAQKTNNSLKHNEKGHIIEDIDNNVHKLINVALVSKISKQDKITKIISEMMEPANVDVIVTGLYIDKGQVVDIRPFTIVKQDQKIVTKIATFKKKDFLCPDNMKKGTKVLCKEAYDEISKLVQELLESL